MHHLKLPNPTYYLLSPDLPGLSEPKLSPRSHFRMNADGSSGKTAGGESIPNVDSTLSTYDMEDAAMHFNFDPALQGVYVQGQKFTATPGMVALANAASRSRCTIIGLTGRNDVQKAATPRNLSNVGYTGFTAANMYTKWTGKGVSQQPSYIKCVTAKCTTIKFKGQTRVYKQTSAGGRYTILANFGDQFSELTGGSAAVPVKLPNPTYYLP